MGIITKVKDRLKRHKSLEQIITDTEKKLRIYEEMCISEERNRKIRLDQYIRLVQDWEERGYLDRVDALVHMFTEKITLERGIEAFTNEPEYNKVYFDGTYWCEIQGEHAEEIIDVAANWEMGVIFELRRPRCR